MESKEQSPNEQQNDTNHLDNQRQNIEKSEYTPKELEKLFQEKLQLVEQGKELRKMASSLLQENLKLNHERDMQEQALIKSEKDAKKIAEIVGNRLSDVFKLCSERKGVYEAYLDSTFKRLQDARLCNNENKGLLEEKHLKLKGLFKTFEEQLEMLNTLPIPDLEVLCVEDPECSDTVIKNCNIMEEICFNLTSLILEE